MECPSGHPNQPGHKFCSQCGQAMSKPVPAAAISAPEKPAAAPADGPAPGGAPAPGRAPDALQALCAAHNIDPAGTSAELIVKVSAAGLTFNDLMGLQPVPA